MHEYIKQIIAMFRAERNIWATNDLYAANPQNEAAKVKQKMQKPEGYSQSRKWIRELTNDELHVSESVYKVLSDHLRLICSVTTESRRADDKQLRHVTVYAGIEIREI